MSAKSGKLLPKPSLDSLRRYDTPTVCNVIELFAVRSRAEGFMDARIKARFPEFPPMVGSAATATFRSASPAGNEAYAGIEDQATEFDSLAGPPVVVFHDLDDPPASATFRASASMPARIDFDEPQRPITPGQAVVCYDPDLAQSVPAGGWIN